MCLLDDDACRHFLKKSHAESEPRSASGGTLARALVIKGQRHDNDDSRESLSVTCKMLLDNRSADYTNYCVYTVPLCLSLRTDMKDPFIERIRTEY